MLYKKHNAYWFPDLAYKIGGTPADDLVLYSGQRNLISVVLPVGAYRMTVKIYDSMGAFV